MHSSQRYLKMMHFSLLYLSVSAHAVIGQFKEPYLTARLSTASLFTHVNEKASQASAKHAGLRVEFMSIAEQEYT